MEIILYTEVNFHIHRRAAHANPTTHLIHIRKRLD